MELLKFGYKSPPVHFTCTVVQKQYKNKLILLGQENWQVTGISIF